MGNRSVGMWKSQQALQQPAAPGNSFVWPTGLCKDHSLGRLKPNTALSKYPGSYWDNGKEDGNYYSTLGLYWDNGKDSVDTEDLTWPLVYYNVGGVMHDFCVNSCGPASPSRKIKEFLGVIAMFPYSCYPKAENAIMMSNPSADNPKADVSCFRHNKSSRLCLHRTTRQKMKQSSPVHTLVTKILHDFSIPWYHNSLGARYVGAYRIFSIHRGAALGMHTLHKSAPFPRAKLMAIPPSSEWQCSAINSGV